MDPKEKPENPTKKPDEKLPEQKLGDTPVAPWEMPTPEEKAKAEPVKEALKKAVEKVDTPEKADAVAASLAAAAGNLTAYDVEQATKEQKAAEGGDALGQSAEAVKQAAQVRPAVEKAADVIAKTAQEIAGSGEREREALSQAAQEVLNPEQQADTTPAEIAAGAPQRQLLRRAFIKRMKPVDALDAEIYLAVNHMPHNRMLNAFFYALTQLFRGGLAWYGVAGMLALFGGRQGRRAVREVAVPLAMASFVVEYPIKTFFRRRRPFITLIEAVVIGKKPGNWSFPSGHSAGAFGGAYLLGRLFPRQRWLFYTVAGLVAFSRIYLGDHYPGDVVSGSVSGILLAKGAWEVQKAVDKLESKANPF